MNLIEELKPGFEITLDKLVLVIDEGEMRIKHFGDQNVNLPMSFFIRKDENIYPLDLHKCRLKMNRLSFFSEQDGKDILTGNMRIQNNKLLINAKSDVSSIGMMWPAVGDIYAGDEMESIDKKYTYSAQFGIENDENPYTQQLRMPSLTHVFDNFCLSVFSRNSAYFNVFKHKYNSYCNIECNNDLNITMASGRNKRNVLYRYGHNKRQESKYCLDIYRMQEILYHNVEFVEPNLYYIASQIKDAKIIQSKLRLNGVKNCIIGSCAMFLHKLNHSPGDIDILVPSKEDLEKCSKIFSIYNIHYPTASKWEGNSISFSFSEHTKVDIGYALNLDWDKDIVIKDEMRIISRDKLLFMKLLGDYETRTMNPGYKNFYNKNSQNIHKLLSTEDIFMYPFFKTFLHSIEENRFFSIHNSLKNAEWDDSYLQINKPLYCNAYNNGHNILIPIVNRSEHQPALIRIDKLVKEAEWHPLEEDACINCVVKQYNTYSEIQIEKVEFLGLLVIYQ